MEWQVAISGVRYHSSGARGRCEESGVSIAPYAWGSDIGSTVRATDCDDANLQKNKKGLNFIFFEMSYS